MTTMPFDTLQFSKTLQNSGFTQEQAEAMARAQHQAIQNMLDKQDLATKNDLKMALTETKSELIERIAESKHEMGYGHASSSNSAYYCRYRFY